MYGAQTETVQKVLTKEFENDVEMYGAQTKSDKRPAARQFENDVEMYGAQTFAIEYHTS